MRSLPAAICSYGKVQADLRMGEAMCGSSVQWQHCVGVTAREHLEVQQVAGPRVHE